MNSIQTEISQSAIAFKNIVWPIVSAKIGGGEILVVEGNTTDYMKKSLVRSKGRTSDWFVRYWTQGSHRLETWRWPWRVLLSSRPPSR